jgi:hypothetical protein
LVNIISELAATPTSMRGDQITETQILKKLNKYNFLFVEKSAINGIPV